jgi:hypothetical protein
MKLLGSLPESELEPEPELEPELELEPDRRAWLRHLLTAVVQFQGESDRVPLGLELLESIQDWGYRLRLSYWLEGRDS